MSQIIVLSIFKDKNRNLFTKLARGSWRRLEDEELHSLYSLPNKSREIKPKRLMWGDHVARMEEGRTALKIIIGKPTGKRPSGRPKWRWDDNIRIDLKKTRKLVDAAQDSDYWRALVNSTFNLRVP